MSRQAHSTTNLLELLSETHIMRLRELLFLIG